ncbi:hypothetical protein [Paenibacillus illinoisensis]|uniref:hypothetical protein n=1 Tax=Paenibacillus illinoisensis TaxID=59845 RepID=UPI00301C70FF
MAQSAIRYAKQTRYIQDAQLGRGIHCIFKVVDGIRSVELIEYEWLLNALNEWWSDFEDMPPGLKDIELDKWLTDVNRKDYFYSILIKAREKCDESLKEEISKFIEVLHN